MFWKTVHVGNVIFGLVSYNLLCIHYDACMAIKFYAVKTPIKRHDPEAIKVHGINLIILG